MQRYFNQISAWIFLGLTFVVISFLFRFVDLTPHVGYDVFFSDDDPSYKADTDITKDFKRNDSQILLSFSGDIQNPVYQKKIQQFSDLLLTLNEVQDVKSVMRGPRSVNDALASPLWSRLLISDGGHSSNMLVILKNDVPMERFSQLIPRIESLKTAFESEDFIIKISGFPYITELIRRHLNDDLRMFTTLSFLIFGLVVIFVFHSWRIFLGIVVSCFNAAALTLICSHLLNIKIGILTANLTTIIFVMTLSHIVFLTFNWKHVHPVKDGLQAANEAIKITLPASFWSMTTTLLGFLSLLFVQAKPIRELGFSGSIGTLIAFAMAYSIYPAFLRLQLPMEEKMDLTIARFYQFFFKILDRRQWMVIAVIIGLTIFTSPYLKTLDLDPNLLSFFSKKSEITQGLKHIDEHGGSNPLVIIIQSPTGTPLDTKTNMRELMDLQLELEKNPNVGTLISLPLLVEEARRSSIFSFFFSNRTLLRWMASPKYGEIAKGFTNEDHTSALFFFRMNEDGRSKHRLDVIDEIHQTIKAHHFIAQLTGGIYALQGRLSSHVATSLIYGLGQLLLIFVVIAMIASRGFGVGLAMSISIGIIPLCILGTVGALKLPLDIITAPAANIAISMGIDNMLHMVNIYRRMKNPGESDRERWHRVRERMWEPVMTSMLIVGCGFAVFFFSSFPPTQRFGGSIVLGTIVAAFSAQFVFPFLACSRRKQKPPQRNRVESFKDINLN